LKDDCGSSSSSSSGLITSWINQGTPEQPMQSLKQNYSFENFYLILYEDVLYSLLEIVGHYKVQMRLLQRHWLMLIGVVILLEALQIPLALVV